MSNVIKRKAAIVASAGLLALLSACGGSGGSDSGSAAGNGTGTDGTTVESNPIVPNDFTFPSVAAANGALDVLPAGPLPLFPARRTLATGTGGTVEFGDPVVLSYNLYSWSTGELIESTSDFEDPITVRAGVTQGIPDYLSNSLLGRNIGDKMQIIFHPGMEDLPEYLDSTDAYVVVLDLI